MLDNFGLQTTKTLLIQFFIHRKNIQEIGIVANLLRLSNSEFRIRVRPNFPPVPNSPTELAQWNQQSSSVEPKNGSIPHQHQWPSGNHPSPPPMNFFSTLKTQILYYTTIFLIFSHSRRCRGHFNCISDHFKQRPRAGRAGRLGGV